MVKLEGLLDRSPMVAGLHTGMRGRGLDHPPDEAYRGPKPLRGGDTSWTDEPPMWQTCGEVP